jgi:hypothetical protein
MPSKQLKALTGGQAGCRVISAVVMVVLLWVVRRSGGERGFVAIAGFEVSTWKAVFRALGPVAANPARREVLVGAVPRPNLDTRASAAVLAHPLVRHGPPVQTNSAARLARSAHCADTVSKFQLGELFAGQKLDRSKGGQYH